MKLKYWKNAEIAFLEELKLKIFLASNQGGAIYS